MEEKVILVDQSDREIGWAEKMEAHRQALLHRAFSVFIFNRKGQLMLQRRAKGKYHSGGLWTNTVCSHPRPGENTLQAAKRRLREEMGFETEIREIFHFIYKAHLDQGLTEHELDHVFIGLYDGEPVLNPEEADAYDFKYLQEIKNDIEQNPGKYTEWFKIIFQESYARLLTEAGKLFKDKPLVFEPYFEEKIWGGTLLKKYFNKQTPYLKTGESWEISAIPHKESVVRKGFYKGFTLGELWKKLGGDFFGMPADKEFPLLVKYIDAQTDLSVQVHPDDHLALTRHGSYGKNETWYIIKAAPESFIYLGFKDGVTRKDYIQALKKGTVEQLLQKIPVKAGDWFYIPAGTVHAIGRGILLAEVQQSSDITYRIYDYNRRDINGKLRPLHIEEALEAIDFEARPVKVAEKKLETPYFVVEKQSGTGIREEPEVFSIVLNPFSETLQVNGEILRKGETALIFADVNLSIKNSSSDYFVIYPAK